MPRKPVPCEGCRKGVGFEMPITMAFQPIVSTGTRRVFAYEALVRGKDGAGAGDVFARVTDDNRYVFDQSCRSTAIGLASTLRMADRDAILSINFLPDAVYDPRACIRVTLDAARQADFPVDRIMFEFVETERVAPDHLLNILSHYRSLGFLTAIDDFGAGYSGAGLLCDFVPDVVKLDMGLVRGCDADPVRRTILRHTVAMLQELGCAVVAEGIETLAEYETVRESGVDLVQGYLIAAPQLKALPEPWLPDDAGEVAATRFAPEGDGIVIHRRPATP